MYKERDYLFDNAKGILIFLVVFGHMIEYSVFRTTDIVKYVYSGLYIFHMPVFIFISGYFSKKNNEKKVVQLFLTYILWQMVIYPLFSSIALGTSYREELNPLFSPKTTYWYILSLIAWKVITPYLSKLRFSFAITVVAGILIGLTDMKMSLSLFSFGRTIVFYPFFMAGYLITKETFYSVINRIKKHWGIILFVLVVIIGLGILYWSADFLLKEKGINKMLYGKDIYEKIYVSDLIGIATRCLLYVVQFGCTILFFTFIPRVNTFLTKFATNSMLIYLTHSILFKYVERAYLKNFVFPDGWIVIIARLILTYIYCGLLSINVVSKWGSKISTINIDKIFKE